MIFIFIRSNSAYQIYMIVSSQIHIQKIAVGADDFLVFYSKK